LEEPSRITASLKSLAAAWVWCQGRGHACQDFFALWKNADSDVPQLQQAKAEGCKVAMMGRFDNFAESASQNRSLGPNARA
jgi:hypothetical protein